MKQPSQVPPGQRTARQRRIEREASRTSGLPLSARELLEAEVEIARRHFPEKRFRPFTAEHVDDDRNPAPRVEREFWRGVGNGTGALGWLALIIAVALIIRDCAVGG